jgi:hypothetical protein
VSWTNGGPQRKNGPEVSDIPSRHDNNNI